MQEMMYIYWNGKSGYSNTQWPEHCCFSEKNEILSAYRLGPKPNTPWIWSFPSYAPLIYHLQPLLSLGPIQNLITMLKLTYQMKLFWFLNLIKCTTVWTRRCDMLSRKSRGMSWKLEKWSLVVVIAL
jgi:hypothetical protein